MKITVEDFEKIVKSPCFLYLTSMNWLVKVKTSDTISE